jgi:hypothetical protein
MPISKGVPKLACMAPTRELQPSRLASSTRIPAARCSFRLTKGQRRSRFSGTYRAHLGYVG